MFLYVLPDKKCSEIDIDVEEVRRSEDMSVAAVIAESDDIQCQHMFELHCHEAQELLLTVMRRMDAHVTRSASLDSSLLPLYGPKAAEEETVQMAGGDRGMLNDAVGVSSSSDSFFPGASSPRDL